MSVLRRKQERQCALQVTGLSVRCLTARGKQGGSRLIVHNPNRLSAFMGEYLPCGAEGTV